ncbi:inovirus Gp2 family protein [Acinetobacter sp. WCHA55]|uniref:YagK/YfjJ domain-containing protein n=1 Tax=Acinetobacter sp. WCHA55 TaxID=2004646 RepID=UPI000B3CE603|nr:inovirus-type Gp2 protein [Acinetobacter sp. WCHA55]AYA69808.1 inovirus Gp2 family protein [Acinetobacter sp. WCHA55]
MTITNLNSKSYSETEILFAVENFVINIHLAGFNHAQKPEFKELLELFDTIYDIDYCYNDYISAFVILKSDIDQIRFDPLVIQIDSYDFVLEFNDEQLAFYEKMLKMLKGEIERDLHQFRLQEKDNTDSLKEYVEQIFNHHTKVLIVRVDLGYLNDSKEQITVEQFYRHFEVMRNRLSNQDTFFSNLHGYSWAIEQGRERGYHVHLLLMYDGTKVQNGSYYAQRVGEKWQQITQGYGSYFNLHSKDYINKLRMAGCDIGIGMVSRNNEDDWERVVTVVEYLTDPAKDEQRLRVKCFRNMQTFGKGQFENSKRRGIKK